MKKKVVYIAHALTADTPEGIAENRRKAAKWIAWAALQGVAPSATWIVLTGELDETYREMGLEIDCALIERCDEIWLVGMKISSGMIVEARHAQKCGVPVFDLTGFMLPENIPDGFRIGAPLWPSFREEMAPKAAVEDGAGE